MAVQATIVGEITAVETLVSGIDGIASPKVIHSAFNFSHTVLGTSTITATKVASDTQPLAAGAYTLDLTAVAQAGGTTQSMTGLKLRAYMFRAPTTNTGLITITEGASNGYTVGTAWKETLAPGQRVVKWLDDEAPAIGAADKTLDVTGTGTETFDYVLIAG